MSQRSDPPPQQTHPDVSSTDKIFEAVQRWDKRIKDLKNLDISQIETGYEPNLLALENSIDHSLIRIFGVNTPDYLRYRSAKYLTLQSINIAGSPVSAHVRRENAQRYIAKATAIWRAPNKL